MNPESNFSHDQTENHPVDFWQHFFDQQELRNCPPLEKLVAGCEIIAAVDSIDLLLA